MPNREESDAEIKKLAMQVGRFGRSRSPLQIEIDDLRVVAAGPQIFSIPNSWSFREFLISYGLQFIGRALVAGEKDRNDPQHPLSKQLLMGKIYKEADGTGELAAVNADMEAFIHVAWDIFTLADNEKVQDILIKRLKNIEQYQGARYELFVAASLIRAGFTVEFEDESDVNSTHCEFNAICKSSGKRYSIEVKSRHRDQQTSGVKTAGVFRLLQKALMKAASDERIIFVDVNLPHDTKGSFNEDWHQETMQTITDIETNQKPNNPWPQAIVFFTNGTFSKEGFASGDISTVLISAINHPLFKQNDRRMVEEAYPEIGTLYNSVFNLGFPPNSFPGQGTSFQPR